MEQKVYDTYTDILHRELIVAMGCTEPIAIAYAGALAKKLLGCLPERVDLGCSGNIIKNVKGVTVPNSGGMRGIEIAALLGMTGGDAERCLAVLERVNDEQRAQAKALLEQGVCHTSLIEGEENLDIVLSAFAKGDQVLVEIRGTHTNVVRLEKNGVSQLKEMPQQMAQEAQPDKTLLNVKDILHYGETVDLEQIRSVLERQMECNDAIAKAGLSQEYGACVGSTLHEMYGSDMPEMRAAAAAAAGSDARMNGCPMPVVINSGSGNQGLTITLPVLIYAAHLKAGREKTLRALAIANLMSVHQKRYIGSLSAYCGATSAACSSAVAICWMMGGTYEQICGVITNTLATIGGMLCDGAKSSCASKIATAVYAALLSVRLSLEGRCFEPGEGLVASNVEATIQDIGYVAREGMRKADVEILKLMLENH